jgi:hypothetical protein
MPEENKAGAEQAVRALCDFLKTYYLQVRIPWMHDLFGTEFHQGRAYALTGLALIPEVRAALDTIDDDLGSALESWHQVFEARQKNT